MSSMTRRDFARAAGMTNALSYSRILSANERIGGGYPGVSNLSRAE